MDTEVVEAVTDWDSVPFDDGHAGLRQLPDEEFTGAVEADPAWAFMLNGRIVGIVDGSIESFADADGTAYVAPDPSLPLLFAMLEKGGEQRAKYYTEDTPLSEVDRTLREGNFTGYVELSENVLSGDYYIVYHNGRSMNVAFVGASRRLYTEDEAFERADDEVGIYEVRSVDVDVIDVPEPEGEAGGAIAGAAEESTDSAGGSDDVDRSPEPDEIDSPEAYDDVGPAQVAEESESTQETDAPQNSDTPRQPLEADSASEESPEISEAEEDGEDGHARASTTSQEADEDLEGIDETELSAGDSESESDPNSAIETAPDSVTPEGAPESASVSEAEPVDDGDEVAEEDQAPGLTGDSPGRPDEPEGPSPATAKASESSTEDDEDPATDEDGSTSDVFQKEERWRETKSIPSLDPSNSPDPEEAGSRSRSKSRTSGTARQRSSRSATRSIQRERSGSGQSSNRSTRSSSRSRAQWGDRRATPKDRSEKLKQLEQRYEEQKERADRLESERDTAREELQDARERIEELEAEIDDLESQIDRLQSDLQSAQAATADAGGTASRRHTLSAAEALDGTNLFVRYEKKGGPTLEKAAAGETSRSELIDNLRIEHHTTFETEELYVDAEPFEQFLEDRIEYGFTRWVIEDLLFEIVDTGSVGSMKRLHEAIPRIDRAEFKGSVVIEETDEGEAPSRECDLVLRDRMGDPLFVANFNDSREPARDSMVDPLVRLGGEVVERHEGFGAVFAVTRSFFEPEAMEAAADATGGGLLSRGKQDGFVRVSRKRGFHLCLVETRDGDYHMSEPELS